MGYLFDGICLQNGRDTNMDSLLLTERRIAGEKAMLAVVCDGVGSMLDGAYASIESVRMLSEWFAALTDAERLGLRMRDEVVSINEKIVNSAAERGVQTATTLSALLLAGGRYYVVHAGDSRIYSVGGESLSLLTVDTVNEAGKLTSFIGKRGNPELFYSEGDSGCGTFLLCSDGLHKRIDNDWLARSIDAGNRKAIRKTLNALANQAIAQGENDNISIAIVRIIAGVASSL